MSDAGSTKRLFRNTAMLYVRMLCIMAAGLYTVRVILRVLGEDDYGIYGAVGGAVMSFTFINTSLSGATSRFLAFELGKRSGGDFRSVFSAAVTIHAAVAVLVLILAETAGLVIVANLNIPEGRISAARAAYHLSILTTMLGLVRVPYEAAIIAHEKMDFFAFIGMAEAGMALGLALLLERVGGDKLVWYAVFLLCSTAAVTFAFYLYDRIKFPGCRYRINVPWAVFRPILNFSAWDLYGNMAVSAKLYGMIFLMNRYFGVALNTSQTLTSKVEGAVSGFVDKFLTAVRPQITKSYAAGEPEKMIDLVGQSGRFAYFAMLFLSLPLLLETRFILTLWLKESLPPFLVAFCCLVLIQNLLMVMFKPVLYAIHATGDIRVVSVVNGTLYLLVIPATWLLFAGGMEPTWGYIANIALLLAGQFVNLFTLRRKVKYKISGFLKTVCLRCCLFTVPALAAAGAVSLVAADNWGGFLLTGSTCALAVPASFWFLGMTAEEKRRLIGFVRAKLCGKTEADNL
ncbi:MAG: hypothetical protein PHI85_08300 [Victivallaceae bacterium]|nr:hypothetical protein [Victivallaceae bacterium]